MMQTTLTGIQTFLDEQGLNPILQKETQQLCVIFKLHKAEFPLYIKPTETSPLLQLLMFIPTELDKKHRSDVARVLHYINSQMDLPGFGFDEANGMIFYRLVIATAKNTIDSVLFRTYVNTAKLACEAFAPLIQNVNLGQMAFKEVIEKVKQMRTS